MFELNRFLISTMLEWQYEAHKKHSSSAFSGSVHNELLRRCIYSSM